MCLWKWRKKRRVAKVVKMSHFPAPAAAVSGGSHLLFRGFLVLKWKQELEFDLYHPLPGTGSGKFLHFCCSIESGDVWRIDQWQARAVSENMKSSGERIETYLNHWYRQCMIFNKWMLWSIGIANLFYFLCFVSRELWFHYFVYLCLELLVVVSCVP